MDFPIRLEIETFHGCNARCTFCSIHDWERPQGEMPQEIFEKIIADSQAFLPHLQVIALTSDGEPLMGSRLADRVATCRANGLGNVGFASNGSLMREDLGKSLLDSGLAWISFSFDTLDKHVFEKERVRLKFDETLERILRFIKIRNEGNYETRINMRYLDHVKDHDVFEEYKKFWDIHLRDTDEIHYGDLYDYKAKENGNNGIEELTCSYPIGHILVLQDGIIPLCCQDWNASFAFGNIMNNSLSEIWNSDRWKDVRALHRAGLGGEMELCAGCDLPRYEANRKRLKKTA